MANKCNGVTRTGRGCRNPVAEGKSTCGRCLGLATANASADAAATQAASGASGSDPISEEVRSRSEQLKEAMSKMLEDDRVVEFLKVRGSVRGYSLNNTIMLFFQKPDAKGIFASYSAWQEMGRQVRKGEKGLGIWIPRKRVRYETDAKGEKVLDENGKPKRSEWTQFVWKNTAFDISQTDGPDIAPPSRGEIKGATAENTAKMRSDLMETANSLGITVKEEKLRDGLYGYYNPESRTLVQSEDLDDADKARNLAHELAHALDPALQDEDWTSTYAHSRGDCEAVAEGVAHVISGRYGIDTSESSGGYLTGWINGDAERLEKMLKRIDHVSDKILPKSDIDAKLDKANQAASEKAKQRYAEKKAKKKTAKKRSSRRKAA